MKDTRNKSLMYLAVRGMNISVSRFMDEMQKKPVSALWHLHYREYNTAFLKLGFFTRFYCCFQVEDSALIK